MRNLLRGSASLRFMFIFILGLFLPGMLLQTPLMNAVAASPATGVLST